MKWIIDRIEENIAILENMQTKEKKEVNISLLPSSIHEGSILVFQNDTYFSDNDFEFRRRTEILEKFKRLRSNQ